MPAGTLSGGNMANLDWGRLFSSTGTPELLVMVSLMYMASPLRKVFFSGTTFT